jgi:hypothetical protein
MRIWRGAEDRIILLAKQTAKIKSAIDHFLIDP